MLAAGYSAVNVFAAGLFVSIPTMTKSSSLGFLHNVSIVKYQYQALLLIFFKDNPVTTTPLGTSVEDYLVSAGLDTPSTVWGNVVICLGVFVFYNCLGFLCLKYLYKERR